MDCPCLLSKCCEQCSTPRLSCRIGARGGSIRVALDQMELPRETVAILVRRVNTLDELTRATLFAAAVTRNGIRGRILPHACDLEEGHVHAALAEGRRALLLEAAPRGSHRFVHDAAREALLRSLSEDELRLLNQKVAEALDQFGGQRASRSRTLHGAETSEVLASAGIGLDQLGVSRDRGVERLRSAFRA